MRPFLEPQQAIVPCPFDIQHGRRPSVDCNQEKEGEGIDPGDEGSDDEHDASIAAPLDQPTEVYDDPLILINLDEDSNLLDSPAPGGQVGLKSPNGTLVMANELQKDDTISLQLKTDAQEDPALFATVLSVPVPTRFPCQGQSRQVVVRYVIPTVDLNLLDTEQAFEVHNLNALYNLKIGGTTTCTRTPSAPRQGLQTHPSSKESDPWQTMSSTSTPY
jgi:hypothetical protein